MNLNEDIAGHLEANGFGTQGKELFINELPDTCRVGILVLSRDGAAFNHSLPGYFVAEFRVVVRSVDYLEGRDRAKLVAKLMTNYVGFTTATMEVKQLLALNTPRSYRKSAGGYWEFETEVEITCVDLEP